MGNLILYNPNNIEIVINEKNGDIYTTQSGYQNLSGRGGQTVYRYCKKLGLRQREPGTIKNALTGDLLLYRYITLIPAHLVLEGLIKHNREQAIAMGCAGASIYLYQLAGFGVKVTLTLAANKSPE